MQGEGVFYPNEAIKEDIQKYGYYNPKTKMITWTVKVNYQQNDYEKLIIKDELHENQKLIKDTVKVFKANYQGDTLEKGVVEGNAKVTTTENGFEAVIGKTNQPYILEYQTSLQELNEIHKTYSNTAATYNGKTPIKKRVAEVNIPEGAEYTKKSGVQDGSTID